MGQMGFFDIANRYAGLDAKNDPLVKIDAVVPWEGFLLIAFARSTVARYFQDHEKKPDLF